MTWTYNTSLSTDRDKVRFNIGDTDTNNQRLSDEEILALLTQYPNVVKASIVALEGLIMSCAGFTNERVGEVSVDYSSLTATYKERIVLLKERLAIEGGRIDAGGQSASEKSSLSSNDDRIPPKFTKDLHEFVEVTSDEERDD